MTIFTSSRRFKNYLRDTIIPDSREAGFESYADDLQEALTWLEAYAEQYGEMTLDNEHWIVVGAQVTLKQDVERYPHFIAPTGKSGVIVHVCDDMVMVAMNDHLPGAEEWGNRILWSDTDREMFTEDVRPMMGAVKIR